MRIAALSAVLKSRDDGNMDVTCFENARNQHKNIGSQEVPPDSTWRTALETFPVKIAKIK